MPSLVSCLGGLIVSGVVILFSVHVKSEIWSNEVSDIQYGRLGSRVTLTCGDPHDGSPVKWLFNGSSVLPWQTYTSEGSITMPSARQAMEGNYSCHDEEGTLMRSFILRLGSVRENTHTLWGLPLTGSHYITVLKLPDRKDMPHLVNVTCNMPNHNKIYCKWIQTKKTNLPTLYNSTYSVKAREAEDCRQEQAGLNECSISDPPFWSSKLLVNITESNPLGSNSTLLQLDVHKLLKPDPPEGVTILPVEGQPNQLLVQWSYPASWSVEIMGAFPLTFIVRYRLVGSEYWSMLEMEDETSLKITDALADHLHQIQVRAQDALINHSQWSEWSHVVEARPWARPLEEPTEEPDLSFFINLSYPVRTTEESLDSSQQNGSVGLLVLLGLFAGAMVSVLLTIISLLCTRNRKHNNLKKQELASMVKMKSVPI